ncbi:hypothetical protein RRG08_023872 [Elysia crispata]|uniref:Uncharacterized protein n=1 Tax=Elysia crispata TaxID=231223 RepID=A0AAE1ATL5_9GAST|nr:hypothetical protein RRG08_023872 [Elysia crispata]
MWARTTLNPDRSIEFLNKIAEVGSFQAPDNTKTGTRGLNLVDEISEVIERCSCKRYHQGSNSSNTSRYVSKYGHSGSDNPNHVVLQIITRNKILKSTLAIKISQQREFYYNAATSLRSASARTGDQDSRTPGLGTLSRYLITVRSLESRVEIVTGIPVATDSPCL